MKSITFSQKLTNIEQRHNRKKEPDWNLFFVNFKMLSGTGDSTEKSV